ncbi:MAG: hypothetical protein HOP10_12960 [Chitinophagaceae bacterium]|nr:hypothetical protein [Chitinophagaceae bacterium]
MKRIFLSFCISFIFYNTLAQTVGIGTTAPNSNALLEISSSTKGILIPRTSTTTRLTIPAVKGLMIYDTTTSSFWYNDGTNWTEILNGSTGWGIKGNNNTNPSLNFIGTADNQPLRFRLNNNWAGEWNRSTRNYSLGDGALLNLVAGNGNIAIGSGTMSGHSNPVGLVAIGDSALANLSGGIGGSNTAIGQRALYANSNGFYNTAVGNLSMPANTTGQHNTAMGASSLRFNTTGFSNVALGSFALYNNKDGDRNIAIGRNALYSDTSSNGLIAIGTGAMANTTSSSGTVAIGDSALYQQVAYTYAHSNTAIGDHALFSNTQGGSNVAVGIRAMQKNTGGSSNTIIGADALRNSLFGAQNVAVGTSALYNSTGNWNTGIGSAALLNNVQGESNTSLGYNALNTNVSGNNNTSIGSSADVNQVALNYATAIGADADVNCSNCLALGGNTSTSRTKVGINQSTPFTDLHIIQQSDNGADKTRGIRLQRSINSNQWRTLIDPSNNYIFEYNNSLYSYIEPVGGAFVNPSDQRLKKNIEPLANVLDKLLMLQPKTYQYVLTDPAYSNTTLTGFLTQDVEKLFPEFVHNGQNGYRGIAYHNFGIIAVKAIQEQQLQIEILKKENAAMKKELQLIKNKIGL